MDSAAVPTALLLTGKGATLSTLQLSSVVMQRRCGAAVRGTRVLLFLQWWNKVIVLRMVMWAIETEWEKVAEVIHPVVTPRELIAAPSSPSQSSPRSLARQDDAVAPWGFRV